MQVSPKKSSPLAESSAVPEDKNASLEKAPGTEKKTSTPNASIARLQDLPEDVHNHVFGYVATSDRPSYSNALTRPHDDAPLHRPEPVELEADRCVRAIRETSSVASAAKMFNSQIGAIHPLVAHQPMLAFIEALGTQATPQNATVFFALLDGVRKRAMPLEASRRELVHRAADAVDPRAWQNVMTLDTLNRMTAVIAPMPPRFIREQCMSHAMPMILELGDQALRAGQDLDTGKMQKVLVRCLSEGIPTSDFAGPSDAQRALWLNKAMKYLRDWHAPEPPRPVLTDFTREMLHAYCSLSPADRQKALPSFNYDVRPYFANVDIQKRGDMFNRLAHALPQQYQCSMLCVLADLVEHIPSGAIGTQVQHLAREASALPLTQSPANVIQRLADRDVFEKMPPRDRQAAASALIEAIDLLRSRGAIEPKDLRHLYSRLLNPVLPTLPRSEWKKQQIQDLERRL